MTFPALNVTSLAMLEVIVYLGLCEQIVQVVMGASMRPRGQRLLPIVAGACVIAHLAQAADVLALISWKSSPYLVQGLEFEGVLPQLWANVALAAVSASLARPLRDRLLWAEAALMLLDLPPLLEALGPWWNTVAALDACGFLAIGGYQLSRTVRQRHKGPTYASTAEAMNVISVGMLVTDGRGGSMFMNDAMRSQLEALGLPTDLGDLSNLWEDVQARAVSLTELGIRGGALPARYGEESNQMLVDMGDGRILSAIIERPDASRRGTRVFSIDITQLIEAARRLSLANDALEQANTQLRNRLAEVQEIAQRAAFLRMRATVHDVIGQRLSILQRYLDAGKVDEESMAQLRALMDSILHDLRMTSGSDPVEHLEDVVDAFALVDVTLVVDGRLPSNQAVSNALVRIVREATTNACQHAQARTVWVVLGRETHGGMPWATLKVYDDGAPSNVPGEGGGDSRGAIREGTGIPGMRRAVEELGGDFSVSTHPSFTISARIPLRQEDTTC